MGHVSGAGGEETSDPRVGALIADKYRVLRLLGAGGMGSVYEAENTALGRRVALKFLHMSAASSEAGDDTALSRFQREARAISAVHSNHIVQVFDWGRDEAGHPFLVMELLDGRDLGERIQRLGRIPVEQAVRYTVEALRGLRKVHAAGIVHRDLKPENLFLHTGDDDQLHVKIVDFGLSKLMDQSELAGPDFATSARLTQAGAVVGTPLYMSPEQVEAVVEIDQRADIWAMGAILYEMLAGVPPFLDRSYARLVMAICQRDPPELRSLNPEVSRELEAVVLGALRRNRDGRYADADAFLQALATLGGVDVTRSTVLAAPVAGAIAVSKTQPQDESEGAPDTTPDVVIRVTPQPRAAIEPPPAAPSSQTPAPASEGVLDATIAAHTRGAATVWLSDAPVFSIWRGEVEAPDRLRVEARDGSVRDLRLEPRGPLTLGRVKQVGSEVNDLVYPDVASRLAAKLRHDGVRWWLMRREECSVPVQVGTRALARNEEAPMVHGTFVTVGAMRATLVDRRYVSRSVPADTVDQATGLLARGGLEQEVATALQHGDAFGLVLCSVMPASARAPQGHAAARGDATSSVSAAVAIHRRWPSDVVARDRETVALLLRGDASALAERARELREVVAESGAQLLGAGFWPLEGEAANAGSEVELALDAIDTASGPRAGKGSVNLRDGMHVRLSKSDDVIERARSPKQQMLLFGIEEQAALRAIGPKVIGALEQELAAILATQIGPTAAISRLAAGVIGVSLPRKIDAASIGVQVQCEWHARPPITDGKVELPRTLSWEEALAERAMTRATELSRECGDAHGVLSALSGGLPYPVAGRVHAAIGAASAVERVKMLFDVLEGTWRFIALVLAAAFFAKGCDDDKLLAQLRAFHDKVRTRAGLPLGQWRELARLCVRGFKGHQDPIGVLAQQLLDVKLTPNQTFDTLSNLLHNERNNFAHGHYNEARAAADVHAFELMTRTFLRALRPLAAWTLVTVQRTEPDLYGESQTVDFIDHTGPYATGARRRIGFHSPIRLANVVYLARWREGLVLPLEPWIRRVASEDRFDLYWIDHVPRAGACNMSAVVSGDSITQPVDARRLPPLLRQLLAP